MKNFTKCMKTIFANMEKQRRRCESHRAEFDFRDGGGVYFRGERARLRLGASRAGVRRLESDEGFGWEVSLATAVYADEASVRAELCALYRREAKRVLDERFHAVVPLARIKPKSTWQISRGTRTLGTCSRGGDIPNVVRAALDCERFGGQGITVHPRPDERHIRYQDVRDLKKVLTTEFNIEGNPIDSFTKLVLEVVPAQVTLVPDAPDAITSNNGWDTRKNLDYLKEIVEIFHKKNIRVSIFLNPDVEMVRYAKETGTDRIELYTEAYARGYAADREKAIEPYLKAAIEAQKLGLGINAGHDLNLENLGYFARTIPGLLEVSIGHALIADALYMGLENTIQLYLRELKQTPKTNKQ